MFASYLILFLFLTSQAFASVAVVQHKHGNTNGAAATSISVTVTSTTAGNNLFFQLNIGGSPFLIGCTGNSSPVSYFIVAFKGTNSVNQSYSGYLLNIPSAITSITCNFTATDNQSSALEVWEVSGMNHPIEYSGEFNNTTSLTSNVITGQGTTSSGVNGFMTAFVNGGASITANPQNGNEWSCGGDTETNSSSVAVFGFVSLCNPTVGTHTPQWSDSGANSSSLQEQESSFSDVGGLTVNGEFTANKMVVNSN